MAGTKAYVHFERKDGSGQFQEVPGETREVTIDANAKFAFNYWGIGGGEWRAKVVFPGSRPIAARRFGIPALLGRWAGVLDRAGEPWLLPDPPNSVPNHNMCIDVYGADPANNALLKLYQCIPGAANQEWQIIPLEGQSTWFASIAQALQQMHGVTGNNPSNGALIEQWTCVWSGNQQWRWHKIG